MTEYERWLAQDLEDNALNEELASIQGNEEEINDRFYQDLAFGTAGLRGVLGAGTNRINIYTVRKATQGLADYLNKKGSDNSVAIAYDSRINSDVFAKEAAATLAANGVKAYIYPELMPTPALSFAVRYLKCDAGINITASHNPAKYNGYKAYGSDGCQVTAEMADGILAEMNKLDIFSDVKHADYDEAVKAGQIEVISEEVTEAFLKRVQEESIIDCTGTDFSVVYTPLNGAGRRCVTTILDRIGIKNVTIVPEQEWPDGNFTTCPYPNPEIREALQKGLDLCEKVQPDLLLATDPDCDRVGIAVKDAKTNEFKLLSGNEVGVLLLDFIAKSRIEEGKMPKDPVAVKTIVSTDLTQKVADYYGIDLKNVLTGFKYIGDQIAILEAKGQEDRYIFGFEESYGYLSGGYVRDKDAVDGSMLICQMAVYYKRQGKTLIDALEELYMKHGYFMNKVLTFTFEGESGMIQMRNIMDNLRTNGPKDFVGYPVIGTSDYQQSIRKDGDQESVIDLPKSNVLEFRLADDNKVIVRPSGTEPKIKVYLSAKGATRADGEAIIAKMADAAPSLLEI